MHGTRIQAALDPNERPMHCHHEKLVVIDDEVAFVGGIELTDLGGDRYDTPELPARGRMGWHDVASRLRGPAVADVAQRWQAVTGERLEAWDVHRGRLIGRCEQQTGIAPFGRLVEQVMSTEPYARARRVFWIVDNGSSHRGQPSISASRASGPTSRSCTCRSTPAG